MEISLIPNVAFAKGVEKNEIKVNLRNESNIPGILPLEMSQMYLRNRLLLLLEKVQKLP